VRGSVLADTGPLYAALDRDDTWHRRAQDDIERLLAYTDQPLSLVDAVLAVVSSRLASPVWTFDHHFDVLRAEVWRGAS